MSRGIDSQKGSRSVDRKFLNFFKSLDRGASMRKEKNPSKDQRNFIRTLLIKLAIPVRNGKGIEKKWGSAFGPVD